jgi:hypothetical protein
MPRYLQRKRVAKVFPAECSVLRWSGKLPMTFDEDQSGRSRAVPQLNAHQDPFQAVNRNPVFWAA